MSRDGAPSRPNRLLLAVPTEERATIEARGQRIALRPKQILYRQGDTVDRVYLLGSGAVSLLSVMLDGRCADVGLVGCEGAVGVVCGLSVMPCEAVVQASGDALMLHMDVLQENAASGGRFSTLLCHYSHALLLQTMQNAACNKLHTVKQRAARWLLAMQDRSGGSALPLTQEALGTMLGVRRQSVNAVAQGLQDADAIDYRHGRVVIRDRAKLQAAACECHRIIYNHFTTLFDGDPDLASIGQTISLREWESRGVRSYERTGRRRDTERPPKIVQQRPG